MERFLKLPRYPFTRAMIEYAPETHGVYGFFEGEGIIYIGKAVSGMTIKTCLLLHQDGSFGNCTMKATAYTWEIISWPTARETELLAAFFKAHAHDPRCQAATATSISSAPAGRSSRQRPASWAPGRGRREELELRREGSLDVIYVFLATR